MNSLREALLAQAELGGDLLWWDEPYDWTPPSQRKKEVHRPVAPQILDQKWSGMHVATQEWNWLPQEGLQKVDTPEFLWEFLAATPPYQGQGMLRDHWKPGVDLVLLAQQPSGLRFWTEEEELLLSKMLGRFLQKEIGNCYQTLLSKREVPSVMYPREKFWHRQVLLKEIELLKPKAVLVFGEELARILFLSGDPMSDFMSGPRNVQGVSVWTSWSLQDYLREPALRVQAVPVLESLQVFLGSNGN